MKWIFWKSEKQIARMTTPVAESVNMIIAEVVETTDAVNVVPMIALPVSDGELIRYDDYDSDDDEIEFVKGILELQESIEGIILGDDPSSVFIPTEDGLPPIMDLLIMIDDLKNYKFGNRVLARMERQVRGENIVIKKMTELEKANSPEYTCCPDCHRYIKHRSMKKHYKSPICVKVATALRLKAVDDAKPSGVMYATTLTLENMIVRSNDYKKTIMTATETEELEAEVYEECVYVIKTYEYNDKEKTIDYAGLWDNCDGKKQFDNEEEARDEFSYATEGDKGYIAVELIRIDPNSENRETCIAEWEDNIDDYLPEEDVEV